MKSTARLRSSVIDMLATMASYLRASSPGMIPSQSWRTNSHVTFILSQSAWAISMSKPMSSPDGSIWLNGG